MSELLKITHFPIKGPALIQPVRHKDPRGQFCETWNASSWQACGLPSIKWQQDNEAITHTRGTLRGLHFQAPPAAQAKLIRVVRGAIFDVAVDLRKSSPTYGQHIACTLSADNGDQFLIPHGFAHGYQTLQNETIVAYKCDQLYNKDLENGLLWSDADLMIAWPVKPVSGISDKDKKWSAFQSFDSPFKGSE